MTEQKYHIGIGDKEPLFYLGKDKPPWSDRDIPVFCSPPSWSKLSSDPPKMSREEADEELKWIKKQDNEIGIVGSSSSLRIIQAS